MTNHELIGWLVEQQALSYQTIVDTNYVANTYPSKKEGLAYLDGLKHAHDWYIIQAAKEIDKPPNETTSEQMRRWKKSWGYK